MRIVAALLIGLACVAPSGAQWVSAPAPIMPVPQTGAPLAAPLWNPASDYVTAGQDEPGYRAWLAARPWRAGWVRQFHDYLSLSGVSFVAPTWQLLRTASDWQRCGAEPFEVPSTEDWPNIVNTLRYVRDHVVPRVGPVEPVSVFRNAGLNRCAGGAPESVHRSMSAIDFVPLQPIDRQNLIRRLCAEHQMEGPRFNAGLGFYTKLRFHVDSWKYRTWGRGDHGETACPKVQSAPVFATVPQQGGTTQPAEDSSALVFRTVPATTATATVIPQANPARDPLAPLPTTPNSGR